MKLKFANPVLADVDRLLAFLSDGEWHKTRGLGCGHCATAQAINRGLVETRPSDHPFYLDYRLTNSGKSLAALFANLRGTENEHPSGV